MTRTSRRILLAVAAGLLAAGVAIAEDMKFEPLSPESAAAIEGRAKRRSAPAVAPATPGTPASPAVPAAPERPSVVIGKSGDIMRVGSDVTIGEGEVVAGDVLAVGGNLTIEGHVQGNAVSMGGDVFLRSGARVDGDVVCMGGELHEDTGASVGGKRVVGLGGKGLGERRARRTVEFDGGDARRHTKDLSGSIAWLLVWLLIGWTVVKLTPGRTAAAIETFRRAPGTSFLVGWLALVLTVPALIAVVLLFALLCITIIGIPLALALLFGYFLFLAVFVVWGGVVGAAVVGERVAVRRGVAAPSLMRATITGVIVLGGAEAATLLLQAMTFIPPFVGLGKFLWVLLCIATILVGVAGWGTLLYSEFTTGLIARWWHGRRPGAPPAPPPPPPPAPPAGPQGGPATAVTTVEVPPAAAPPPPPSPPGAFMPPPEERPPGPTPGS